MPRALVGFTSTYVEALEGDPPRGGLAAETSRCRTFRCWRTDTPNRPPRSRLFGRKEAFPGRPKRFQLGARSSKPVYDAAVITQAAALSVYSDRASAMRAVASRVVMLAHCAIGERGRFTWALAGGSTPKEVYELLASPEFSCQVDWTKVEIFWGDERCVGPESAESNYKMANEALLAALPLLPSQIHRMAGELDPDAAAAQYSDDLRRVFRGEPQDGRPPSLDLVLLGMGDDGHTASLFPNSPALNENNRWVCAAQKGAQWRLTLTFPVLNAARDVLFLVVGPSKRTMLANVLGAQGEPTPWPAAQVRPPQGRVTWFVDRDADPSHGDSSNPTEQSSTGDSRCN